jgi:hypothetical protein
MVRRSRFDPFARTTERRWLVVRNQHSSLIDSCELAPDTNLTRAFVASILEWIDDGWTIGEFSSTAACFFCWRGTERRRIAIEAFDPRAPLPNLGASHLMRGLPER